MVSFRSFADLAVLTSPSIAPVIVDAIEVGHLVIHGESQASAYDSAGRWVFFPAVPLPSPRLRQP